jgi:hypothetical protein
MLRIEVFVVMAFWRVGAGMPASVTETLIVAASCTPECEVGRSEGMEMWLREV